MRPIISALFITLTLTAAADITERNVKVINPDDNVALAGTLALPKDGKPKAVLILATGSGCQDRDETIYDKKPFKTIADSLATHGYASLRFDDRGAGESGGDYAKVTAATFLSDIKCMLTLSDSIFENVPTGILGHSEGAWTAMQAAQDSKCDFIITLAGAAWQGDSIIMSQSRVMAVAATGRWDKESTQRKLLDICMLPLPGAFIKAQLCVAIGEEYGEAATLPSVQKQIGAIAEAMTSAHYMEMLKYNPADDIRNVNKPWLAVNGSVDMQVLPENLNTIKELNPRVDTVLLDGHNHLFQKGGTGMINEYQTLEGDISAECIEVILDWLGKL